MIRIVIVAAVMMACGSRPPPPSGSTPPEAAGAAAPAPAGCVRLRASHHFHCTGVDTGDSNTYPVTVCDGCATGADCTARPGGTCASTGGAMCEAPAAFVCRYPKDICDGCVYCTNNGRGEPVCRNQQPSAPPAMDSGAEPPQQVPRPTRNDPRKAPKANAATCKADLEHCCTSTGAIEWLNGCCGGALPAHCRGLSGHAGERGANGMCVGCQRKCLPATARIATPRGDREIATLAVGELVWTTTAEGARIAAPIEAIGSLPIEGLHELVVVSLDDGRRIRASAGHPTAAMLRLDALQLGDRVDGARVTDIAREPYLGAATWDLRPAGGSTYWVDGVLLGTTLTH